MTLAELNLDGMNVDELWKFAMQTNSVRPISFARSLFTNCPKGYVRATKNLGHYAANKATAMMQRERGNIETALMYESIADRIYDELPEYAQW